MYGEPRFLAAGDTAMAVEMGNEIREDINRQVRTLMQMCRDTDIRGLEEMVPTYRSLLIYYDPALVTFFELKTIILDLLKKNREVALPHFRLVHIPTLYGDEMGPDLEDVARYNQLSPGEVIQIHSSARYLVYMLGFTPGFCYLGGSSPRIAMPRLANPRIKIPAGSVGLAGTQTGIYPVESPGGWRLIGRTPVKIFAPHEEYPFLLRAGDYLKFDPVNPAEYMDIQERVAKRQYKPVVEGVAK